jgi:hypothetical protein
MKLKRMMTNTEKYLKHAEEQFGFQEPIFTYFLYRVHCTMLYDKFNFQCFVGHIL